MGVSNAEIRSVRGRNAKGGAGEKGELARLAQAVSSGCGQATAGSADGGVRPRMRYQCCCGARRERQTCSCATSLSFSTWTRGRGTGERTFISLMAALFIELFMPFG